MLLQNDCTKHIEWYRTLKGRLGCFDHNKNLPLLYSPPEIKIEKYIVIDFFCLVSVKQWEFDKSSNVFIRFAAKELGTFDTCHGPMSPTHKRYSTVKCKEVFCVLVKLC